MKACLPKAISKQFHLKQTKDFYASYCRIAGPDAGNLHSCGAGVGGQRGAGGREAI
jgi:hypothetical protein